MSFDKHKSITFWKSDNKSNYICCQSVLQFAEAIGVDFETKTIKAGAELGVLNAEDFVDDNGSSFWAAAICSTGTQQQKSVIDAKEKGESSNATFPPVRNTRAQDLITAFLGNM